jgi:replicative DNA helicase
MTAVESLGLPKNLDAERYVLGSILLNDDRFTDVFASLVAADFSLLKHQRIYARMAELHERGERIDRVTLAEELSKHDQLQLVDGVYYLVSLDEGLPNITNLDSYVRIVKEKALLRETMFACQDIMNRCALAGEPTSEILETAAGILEKDRSKGANPSHWCTAGEVLQHGLDEVLFPAAGSTGIKTPWARLTEMTGGWAPGDLTIIAGRPSRGKSVIALQQAYTSACLGIGVAYISLEMSKESLVRRLVASVSRVDSHRARSGFLNSDDRRRMIAAATELQTVPLFLDESRAHTPVAVGAALRKLRARTPIGLVIVDHLQLMKVTGRAESRHSELSEICHGFKRLAGQDGLRRDTAQPAQPLLRTGEASAELIGPQGVRGNRGGRGRCGLHSSSGDVQAR